MKIGYARVSTEEQSLDVQIEQLKAAGCLVIFQEKATGKNALRPQLMRCLSRIEHPAAWHFGDYSEWTSPARFLSPVETPDVLVVTKLDRLARSTKDLLEIVDRLNKAGAGLLSLGEPWADTTSPAGRMVMTVLAGVAEFERERILERTNEGRVLAKRNGVKFGRPEKLTPEQQRAARKMLQSETQKHVARVFKVDVGTIRKLVRG
jgi:DNA invertase Pin-like site-specific DNA recombinase